MGGVVAHWGEWWLIFEEWLLIGKSDGSLGGVVVALQGKWCWIFSEVLAPLWMKWLHVCGMLWFFWGKWWICGERGFRGFGRLGRHSSVQHYKYIQAGAMLLVYVYRHEPEACPV